MIIAKGGKRTGDRAGEKRKEKEGGGDPSTLIQHDERGKLDGRGKREGAVKFSFPLTVPKLQLEREEPSSFFHEKRGK